MKKKDQEAMALLYTENSDMSEFETSAPYKEQEPFEDVNQIEEVVFKMIESLKNMQLPSNVIMGMIQDISDPHNSEDVKQALLKIKSTI